jgi:hypothetical protein
MSLDAVDQVLAQRVRRQQRGLGPQSLGAALLLHAALGAALWIAPSLGADRPPLE